MRSNSSVHDTALAAIEESVDGGIGKSNKCATCGKEFRRVYDLNRHQKLHTGQKPHGCHRCGKKFSRADALIRHMRPMGSCAQRFSLQTAQAASGGDPAAANVSAVLDQGKHNNYQLSPPMRAQYVPVISHSPMPSNMRPEEISALVNRVQTLEQRVSLIEQRMNRAEHRVNRLEIVKNENDS